MLLPPITAYNVDGLIRKFFYGGKPTMQNRYTCDVGDFGKYGLLRRLCGSDGRFSPILSLCVLWYLVPDEGHNADGKHVAYLGKPDEYQRCDPELFDRLHQLVSQGKRDVASIELSGLLGSARYHSEYLEYTALGDRAARQERRSKWFGAALMAADGADLIFVDPDNGLEGESAGTQGSSPKGSKFAMFDEVAALYESGASLVIYHHAGRNGTVAQQASRLVGRLRDAIATDLEIPVLAFRRGTVRLFLLVPNGVDGMELVNRWRSMTANADPWSDHFESIS
ncbi:MAG TPA: hypothetical protein VM325_17255 [Alphaproteobacteria bacterium]|nr:hypothetical protein [Alphaproteobacteria bacterium]